MHKEPSVIRMRKHIVSWNLCHILLLLWDNGTKSLVKVLGDHKVMRSVEVRVRQPPMRVRQLLNKTCTVELLHFNTLSTMTLSVGYYTGYWECMSEDKDLRNTMWHRVLILPNEEILASSANSVPAKEVNLYPRLYLLKPARPTQLNKMYTTGRILKWD